VYCGKTACRPTRRLTAAADGLEHYNSRRAGMPRQLNHCALMKHTPQFTIVHQKDVFSTSRKSFQLTASTVISSDDVTFSTWRITAHSIRAATETMVVTHVNYTTGSWWSRHVKVSGCSAAAGRHLGRMRPHARTDTRHITVDRRTAFRLIARFSERPARCTGIHDRDVPE